MCRGVLVGVYDGVFCFWSGDGDGFCAGLVIFFSSGIEKMGREAFEIPGAGLIMPTGSSFSLILCTVLLQEAPQMIVLLPVQGMLQSYSDTLRDSIISIPQ